MDVISTIPFIYDAAISQKNWLPAVDRIADAVSAKAVMLLAINHSGFSYNLNMSSSMYLNKEAMVADYMQRFGHYEQQGIQHLLAAAPMEPVLDTDMWPDLEALRVREDIAFTRNLLGIYRRVSFNLFDSRELNAGVILQFDQSVEEVTAESINNAKILMPHLAKTIELNRFYFQLQERFNAILSVLDHVRIGVCVASPAGEMLIVNQEARLIFELKDGISLGPDNKIFSEHEDVRNLVKHYLKTNSETARGEREVQVSVVTVPRRSSLEPLLVEISPLRDGDGEFETGFAGTFLTIIDPENSVDFSTEPLGKLYGLTGAEAEIAQLLAHGHTNNVIANMRNVSVFTVRNQCKALYSKTGVKSRSELIRKIVSLSPPIDR